LDVKEAINQTIYLLDQDLQWYLRRASASRKGGAQSRVLKEVIEVRVRLLSPFAPYTCEEVWSMLGKEGFVSNAPWPIYEGAKIDKKGEACEELVRETLRDALNILKVLKLAPKKLHMYVAAGWKWRCTMACLESLEKGLSLGETMLALGIIPEAQVLSDAKDFLSKELSVEVFVYNEDDAARHDPTGRAKFAKPYRPAIYFE